MAKSFEEALADLRAAVEFNRKVIADNPAVETGAWKDAFQWVMNAAHHLVDASAPQSVPDGWKLVPVEPTEEMLSAALKFPAQTRKQYAAMLAAAPEVE
ncbi:hypothetical protein [Pantoea piersonii]|uniref:hypothetical protein n=1 Tax=Pantoea piersonii TaxID=2364647 RepID=UPI0028A1833C|nr:hypothetical protein [Pantoea piersonii]